MSRSPSSICLTAIGAGARWTAQPSAPPGRLATIHASAALPNTWPALSPIALPVDMAGLTPPVPQSWRRGVAIGTGRKQVIQLEAPS